MQTNFAIGNEGKDLTLDRATATGGYLALELHQATLFDPSTVKAAEGMADAIEMQVKAG